MKKSRALISVLLASMSTPIFAHPASTEYVNQRINEANATLTNSIKQAVMDLTNTINGLRIANHYIGEKYQGGVVFFVDDTGLHGLIAAIKDANDGAPLQWQNGESGEKITNAQANGVGAGATNTKLIIAQQTIDYQSGNFAALAASNFSVLADGQTPCSTRVDATQTCYGDWYLPSAYELDLIHTNLQTQGGFANQFYWSSTESTVTEAYGQDIQTGTQSLMDKANTQGLVRAIRAF
jgi:predicted small secreted protein